MRTYQYQIRRHSTYLFKQYKVHTNSVGTKHTNLNTNLVDPLGQVNSIQSKYIFHSYYPGFLKRIHKRRGYR